MPLVAAGRKGRVQGGRGPGLRRGALLLTRAAGYPSGASSALSAASGSSWCQISSPTPKKSVTGPYCATRRLGQRALGHDGHLDGFRPEFEQLELHRACRRPSGVCAERAEGHVIGPRLARRHALVARGAAEGADDGIGAKLLAGMADSARAVGQVDAVEPVAQGKCDMAFDHDGHVAGMGDLAQRIGGAGEAVFVLRRERQADTGDGGAVEDRARGGRGSCPARTPGGVMR